MHELDLTEGDINISKYRKLWAGKQKDDDTQKILKEDENYFIHQALSTPCLNVLSECDGVYLKDRQGNLIFDFHGNNLHQLGFRNQFIIDAIKQQLDILPFCTRRYTNDKAIALAKKLTDLAPGDLNKVLFAPSGALANEMALKLARICTGKNKILTMWDSFHGATINTIAAGGEMAFRYNLGVALNGVEHVPPPASYSGMWVNGKENNYQKCLEYIEYIIHKDGDIAAVFCETIRNTDVQIPSIEYWQKLREICDVYGVMLIVDEIPTWMGRTGKIYAIEHFDIVPDVITVGKALGGGVVPFAAMITRDQYDTVLHSSIGHFTHEKSPVASAAGLASMQFIEEHNLLDRVHELEIFMQNKLIQFFEEFEFIGDVRGIGLLWGLELVVDKKTKAPNNELAEKVMYQCLEYGLSFKVARGNIINLCPPLVIEKEELTQALAILHKVFARFRSI